MRAEAWGNSSTLLIVQSKHHFLLTSILLNGQSIRLPSKQKNTGVCIFLPFGSVRVSNDNAFVVMLFFFTNRYSTRTDTFLSWTNKGTVLSVSVNYSLESRHTNTTLSFFILHSLACGFSLYSGQNYLWTRCQSHENNINLSNLFRSLGIIAQITGAKTGRSLVDSSCQRQTPSFSSSLCLRHTQWFSWVQHSRQWKVKSWQSCWFPWKTDWLRISSDPGLTHPCCDPPLFIWVVAYLKVCT